MNKRIFSIIGSLVLFLFVFMGLTAQLAQASPASLPRDSRCSGTQDTVYQCLDSRDPRGPVYAFQDIEAVNPPLAYSNNDDGVKHITMPFVFTFYGLSSDNLTVSMNGAIKFGSHINTINAFNTDLSVAPAYFIVPFWDDIDNSPGIGGGVYTDVVGTAPNRQFIIQWQDIPHYNNTDAITFQVIFYETSNELLFQYEDVDFGTPNFDWGASATIGIKGENPTGLQYLYNAPVLTNSTAIRFMPVTAEFPEAVGEGYQVNHDTVLSVAAPGVLENDTDVRGNGIAAILDSDAEYGTVNLNQDGSFTYTPDADYVGVDFFQYHVHDGRSNSSPVLVGISVMNNPADVQADSYTTSQSVTLSITAPGVLDNDNDPEGDVITAVLHTNVTHGSLSLQSDGSFSYTPQVGYVGPDNFKYVVNDGLENSSAVNVSLTVENVIPVAVSESYTTSQMTLLTVGSNGVLANDTDAGGDSLTAVLDTAPAHGQLSLNSDGTFTYTPDAGFKGTDSFSYHATDGMDDSNSVMVSLQVENVAPTADNDEYTASPGQILNVNTPGVLGNDGDAGGDVITAVLDTTTAHGNLSLNPDGSFSYTPDPGFGGEDTFTYHAYDGAANSPSVTVTLQVTHQIFLPMIVKP
jgi:VCBS repeat-containing protein